LGKGRKRGEKQEETQNQYRTREALVPFPFLKEPINLPPSLNEKERGECPEEQTPLGSPIKKSARKKGPSIGEE
jgi:hypothetical protein